MGASPDGTGERGKTMRYLMALCVLGLVACDDGDSSSDNTTTDGDGTLGVAVADLSQWGLEACPDGLDEVDGVCVAGSVDMQLDIDDCVVVSKCLPGQHSCARAAVTGYLDRVADSDLPSLGWEDATAAESLNYSTWASSFDERRGLQYLSGQVEQRDADGSSECLIGLEADIVQDHWKWSKVREGR